MYETVTTAETVQCGVSGYSLQILSNSIRQKIHSHNCFELAYLISGKMQLNTENSLYCLSEYDYLLIPCGMKHCFAGDSACGGILLNIHVSEENMKSMFEFFGKQVEQYIVSSNEPLIVSGDFIVKLKNDEIYGRLLKYGDDDRQLCKLLVTEILSGIIRKMHRKMRSDEIPEEIVNAFIEMRKFDNLKEGVPALERLTNYSRPQLCRLVKKYYGHTPADIVSDLRMNFAYNLIKYSNMEFESIAEAVGYSSTSHFYKKFNAFFSLTPSEIRKGGLEINLESKD